MKKLFALVLGLQEPEITAHCFGDCGKALLAGISDPDLGALIPCAQEECPHLEKQMDEPLGTSDGYQIYLRRLVPMKERTEG